MENQGLKVKKQWEINIFFEEDFKLLEEFMQLNDIEYLYDVTKYYVGGRHA